MTALARETGIAEATLYRWRDEAQVSDAVVSKSKKQDRLSGAQKLRIVAGSAGLNEVELAEYCRKQGVYAEQVKQWREQAEAGMRDPMVGVRRFLASLRYPWIFE